MLLVCMSANMLGVCRYMYVLTYVSWRVNVYLWRQTCMNMYVYIFVSLWANMHKSKLCKHMCVYMYACMYVYVYVAYMNICI